MNYGFNVGAAGVIASMHKQDVAANNLANIETVGFKPDFAATIPRQAVRQEDNLFHMPSNVMLERLGAGVLLAPSRTGFSQGALAQSKNPFDVAIDGEGFLTVAGPPNANGRGNSVSYTRDGRLTMDPNGRLVMVTDGRPVLSDNGQTITLDPTLDFQVQSDGSILQDGAEVANLGFVNIPDKSGLRKLGDNLFAASPAAARSARPAPGRIVQFSTEQSASDPIKGMMAVQDAANAVSATVKVMQIQDEMMNRAINTLGRVA